MVDLLLLATARHNFTYTLFFPTDGFWGNWEVDGNGTRRMNGIVGHVARSVRLIFASRRREMRQGLLQDGDIVWADLNINTARFAVIDYTRPFFFTASTFIFKQDVRPVDYLSMFKVLRLLSRSVTRHGSESGRVASPFPKGCG